MAEIKLRECADCQVIPIIDNDVPLGAITQVSEMAINAGFKDIRLLFLGKRRGTWPRFSSPPPKKSAADAEKI